MPRLVRPSPIPSRLVRAAGALVWRFTDRERQVLSGERIDPKDIEVLMVHRPRYHDWSWPKGKAEANEPILSAAAREVEEETGRLVALGAPLTTQRYRLGSGQTKEVRYWVGTLVDASEANPDPAARTRAPVKQAPPSEIDQTRWASPSRADDLLTRRGDRRLLSELVGRAQEGKLVTSSIVLLRHAKAVSRQAWSGGEESRPLTRLGARQSLDLVPLLSALGIDEAYSSPWTRCIDTVAPWAGIAGVEVHSCDALSEWAAQEDTRAAQAVMADLLERAHPRAVISVHRPTIPLLLEPLKAVAPSGLLRAFPSESPWLSTADMLVAHVERSKAQPALLALERHGTRTKTVLGLN